MKGKSSPLLTNLPHTHTHYNNDLFEKVHLVLSYLMGVFESQEKIRLS